jgi:hypothetical protein
MVLSISWNLGIATVVSSRGNIKYAGILLNLNYGGVFFFFSKELLVLANQRCVLCPNRGGAYKQTSSGQWCHVLCAWAVPEVSFGNDETLFPITNLNHIPKARWNLVGHTVAPYGRLDGVRSFNSFLECSDAEFV